MRGIQCEYEKLGANPYYVAQTKAFQRHRQQLDTFLLSSSLDTNMIGLPAASYVDANLLSTLELPAANGDLPSNSITPPINSDNNCFHYLDMTTLQADGQSPHTFGSNASSSDHSNANLSPPESTSIRDSSATSLVSKQSREYAGSVSSPSLHPIDLRIHDSVLKAFQPSTVVIDILKSYPRMLLHARSSPPFIHRAMYPTALPNELAKAINLVNDFESATPDNEEAAFSAVATEQLSLMQAWVSWFCIMLLYALMSNSTDTQSTTPWTPSECCMQCSCTRLFYVCLVMHAGVRSARVIITSSCK